MAKKVQSNDLIEKGIFEEFISDGKKVVTLLDNIEDGFKSVLKTTGETISSFKDIGDLKTFENVKKVISDATIAEQGLTKVQKQRQRVLENLKTLESENGKELERAKLLLQEKRKETKRAIKEEEGLLGAYAEQSAKLSRLKKEYKNLILEEGKATKATDKLLREITQLDREIKDVDASVGEFNRNVGNYADFAKNATKQSSLWLVGLIGLEGGLGDVTSALEANEEGSLEFQKIQGNISATLNVLQNRISKTALTIKDLSTKLIDGSGSVFSYFKAVDDLSNSFDGVGEEIESVNKASDDAVVSTRELAKETLEYNNQLAVLNASIEKLNVTAGDNTKTFDEQQSALFQSNKLNIQRIQILENIATKEAEILKSRIDATDSDANRLALETEFNEKNNELIELKGQLEAEKLDNSKAFREVERDRFERELDFAIDAFDAQKTVNERKIADEQLSLDERIRILDKTKELTEGSFNSQIELLENFTKQQIDLNSLVLEEDEKVIRQRLRQFQFDDVTLGRILEIIRERKLVTQDIADAERDITDAIKEQQDRINEAKNNINQEDIEIQVDRVNRELELNEVKTAKELELEKKLIEDKFNLQSEQLEEQADFELSNNELLAEEKEAIEQKLQNDIERLNLDRLDSIKDAEDKAKEETLMNQLQLVQNLKEGFTAVENGVVEGLQNRNQKINDSLDQEINDRNSAIETIKNSENQALKGQLAFEVAERDKALIEKEKQAQKEKVQELGIAYLKAFQSVLDSDDPSNAAIKAFSQVTVAKALSTAISGGFYDGTESVSKENSLFDRKTSKDPFLTWVNPNERIIDTERNSKLTGLSNETLTNLGSDYLAGDLSSWVSGAEMDFNKTVKRVNLLQAKEQKSIDEYQMEMAFGRALKKYQSTTNIHWQSFIDVVEERIKNNNKQILNFVKRKKLN